jgi:hypothetical protein
MRNGFISHTASGALGGAMGTLVLSGMNRISKQLPEALRPPAIRRDPGDFIVAQLEELLGRPLPREAHEILARSFHWVHGIGWASLLGLVMARRRVTRVSEALLAGAGLGTVVWAVSYAGLLPAAKLTPPLHRQGGKHVASALIGYVLYGVVSVLPILALDRALRARRDRWRFR